MYYKLTTQNMETYHIKELWSGDWDIKIMRIAGSICVASYLLSLFLGKDWVVAMLPFLFIGVAFWAVFEYVVFKDRREIRERMLEIGFSETTARKFSKPPVQDGLMKVLEDLEEMKMEREKNTYLGTIYRCRRYSEINSFILTEEEWESLSPSERNDIVSYTRFYKATEDVDGSIVGYFKSPCDGGLVKHTVYAVDEI